MAAKKHPVHTSLANKTYSHKMATATVPKLENPRNDTVLNSKLQATENLLPDEIPASSGVGFEESEGKSAAATANDADGGNADTDIQKKAKRAERFGMTVHLSEEEKRNSRAERFGAGFAANKLDTSKPLEELKRKSRAERFGIIQSDPSDEEAKKKARQARFESFSKTDSVEEDKRKARAVRFSQPDSGSKANEKGNVDVKTAIAETADGGT
ncbi:hypothetical protein ABFS83_12G137400 [Erythranthe nasuta]